MSKAKEIPIFVSVKYGKISLRRVKDHWVFKSDKNIKIQPLGIYSDNKVIYAVKLPVSALSILVIGDTLKSGKVINKFDIIDDEIVVQLA